MAYSAKFSIICTLIGCLETKPIKFRYGKRNETNQITQLASVDNYGILNHGGCTEVEGVNDAEQFRGVQKALDTVGMAPDTQMRVMQ